MADEHVVADMIVSKLTEFGADYIFGIPGTQINPVIEALRKTGKPKYILVRDEGAGAVMASVYSRVTGRLGACLGMAGPGGVKLLPGLYTAKADHSPIVAVTGTVESYKLGSEYTQEVDLYTLFSDVSVFNHLLATPKEAGRFIANACRTAVAKRGVAHLCIPVDVQEEQAGHAPENDPIPLSTGYLPPKKEELLEAARLLDEAERIVILVGRGAHGCSSIISKLAEKLSAPVFTTFPGRDSLRGDDPHNMGVLWIFSPRALSAVKEADAALLVGTDYPYLHDVIPSEARVTQIESSYENIGKRIKVDAPVLGDSMSALTGLMSQVKGAKSADYLAYVKEEMSEFRELLESKRNDSSKPINPYFIIKIMENVLDDDAYVTLDAGAVELYFTSGFGVKQHTLIIHGRYASLGYGIPAAIGAKLAAPDKQVVAVEGDLGMMTCMAELMTAVQYKLPVKIVVFNNGTQAAVKFEQLLHGFEEFGTHVGDMDFAKFAEACGCFGLRVDEPQDLESAAREVFESKAPAVLDVVTSGDQLPIF